MALLKRQYVAIIEEEYRSNGEIVPALTGRVLEEPMRKCGHMVQRVLRLVRLTQIEVDKNFDL